MEKSNKAEKEAKESADLIKIKEKELSESLEARASARKEIVSLQTRLKASEKQRDSLEGHLCDLEGEYKELEKRTRGLKEEKGSVIEESSAKHKAAASLRQLAESLQLQLDEMTTLHSHMSNELDRERTNLSCAEEERDSLVIRLSHLENKMEKVLREREMSEKESTKTVSILEETMETLSNQLGSLVDSGEAFESNAQKREDNLMQQIQVLRRGRKKDREAYKTAVDSSNAWKLRAENAESMVANSKLINLMNPRDGKVGAKGGRGERNGRDGSSVPSSARSTNSKGERRGSNSGKSSGSVSEGGGRRAGGGRGSSGESSSSGGESGGGELRGKNGASRVRPTPPTNDDHKNSTNQMSSGAQRRNRKVVANQGNTTLPPVMTASPTPLRAGPA
jgi:hypothetical protein